MFTLGSTLNIICSVIGLHNKFGFAVHCYVVELRVYLAKSVSNVLCNWHFHWSGVGRCLQLWGQKGRATQFQHH